MARPFERLALRRLAWTLVTFDEAGWQRPRDPARTMAIVSHHDHVAVFCERRDHDEITQADRVEIVDHPAARQPDVLLEDLEPRLAPEDARGGFDNPVAPVRRVTTPDQGSRWALHTKGVMLLGDAAGARAGRITPPGAWRRRARAGRIMPPGAWRRRARAGRITH